MRDDCSLDYAFEGKVEDIAGTEAVACCTELGDATLFEAFDHSVEGWAGLVPSVVREPRVEVELENTPTSAFSSYAITRLRAWPLKKLSGTGSPLR